MLYEIIHRKFRCLKTRSGSAASAFVLLHAAGEINQFGVDQVRNVVSHWRRSDLPYPPVETITAEREPRLIRASAVFAASVQSPQALENLKDLIGHCAWFRWFLDSEKNALSSARVCTNKATIFDLSGDP